jgi:hypothetical protein
MSHGWKMVTLWDTNYDSLNQLRQEQKATFNDVVSKLLEMYEKEREPEDEQE